MGSNIITEVYFLQKQLAKIKWAITFRTSIRTLIDQSCFFFYHVFQHLMGQVVSVESTGTRGPAGVKVTLARTPVKSANPDEVGATTQDPEYYGTVSAIV